MTTRPPVVLWVAALALFLSGAHALPLLPLDDSFYARKGVEMARHGPSLTVTWNGEPTFQNPPLPFLILAASFRTFGKSDFAARLPAALMAIGILVLTWRLGRELGGPAVATAAGALLAITPLFLTNARRCMMEIPTAFWTTLAMLVIVLARRRPALGWWLAFPLGAALLTKSVLGAMPLVVLAVAAAMAPAWRRVALSAPILGGALIGLAIGAIWPLHQAAVHGLDAVRAHYFGEIVQRSGEPIGLIQRVFGYPLILVQHFEPVLALAVVALIVLVRRRPSFGDDHQLLVAWAFAPPLLYMLSSAQSARYVFPALPALALLGAPLFVGRLQWIPTRLIPALLAIGAVVFHLAPEALTRRQSLEFKRDARSIGAIASDRSPLPFVGAHYWSWANPLLYYAERPLAPDRGAEEAVSAARLRTDRALLVENDRLAEVRALAPELRVAYEGRGWVIVVLPAGR